MMCILSVSIEAFSLCNRIVIRIRCDAKNTPVVLGLKFGSEPDEETMSLIQLAKHLGLNLYGFSFHVGTPCGEMEAYARGIELCKQLINTSKAIGHENVQMIDIGGGFPGESGTNVDMVYLSSPRFSSKIFLIFLLHWRTLLN